MQTIPLSLLVLGKKMQSTVDTTLWVEGSVLLPKSAVRDILQIQQWMLEVADVYEQGRRKARKREGI